MATKGQGEDERPGPYRSQDGASGSRFLCLGSSGVYLSFYPDNANSPSSGGGFNGILGRPHHHQRQQPEPWRHVCGLHQSPIRLQRAAVAVIQQQQQPGLRGRRRVFSRTVSELRHMRGQGHRETLRGCFVRRMQGLLQKIGEPPMRRTMFS